MIREFANGDLERFSPNDMSAPDARVMAALGSEDWWNYTLEHAGEVRAIISFAENADAPGEWLGFTLISKNITARDSVEIKKFMDRCYATLKPRRFWTLSRPLAPVDKWHQFLGFVKERAQEFEGEIYNIWGRTWA